jgi:hypothetical protein
METLTRREFMRASALAGAGTILSAPSLADSSTPSVRPEYRGPNVVIIRFGGGVRRQETIQAESTWSPYLCRELAPRGVLFPRMEIDQFGDYATSHGEGTLYILTGRYEKYRDVAETRAEVPRHFLGARFEARVPTLFEYLREAYNVPDHQALLVNGEDRGDEEFYNFSNHHLFGVRYRSQTLSLRRYKTWLLKTQIAAGRFDGGELAKKQADLAKLDSLDYRASKEHGQGGAIEALWDKWRSHFGESGLVNPRGDRLLTELALWAVRDLQPKLMMINYQDCDYVHWGYMDHYTRGVAIMDLEVKRLVSEIEALPAYRDNTVFVVVPDCGRDNNPYTSVPCQHHFGSRSSHEIFALFFGAGIPKGVTVAKTVSQAQVAATIGGLMQFKTSFAESNALEEAMS